jgi:hypothetical protein
MVRSVAVHDLAYLATLDHRTLKEELVRNVLIQADVHPRRSQLTHLQGRRIMETDCGSSVFKGIAQVGLPVSNPRSNRDEIS